MRFVVLIIAAGAAFWLYRYVAKKKARRAAAKVTWRTAASLAFGLLVASALVFFNLNFNGRII